MVDLGFTFQGTSQCSLTKMQNIYGQGANGIYSPAAIVSWGCKNERTAGCSLDT